jgi:hypothetical protein
MSKIALSLSSGSLDQVNTRELVERITEAAKRARLDIIINFEHLKDLFGLDNTLRQRPPGAWAITLRR